MSPSSSKGTSIEALTVQMEELTKKTSELEIRVALLESVKPSSAVKAYLVERMKRWGQLTWHQVEADKDAPDQLRCSRQQFYDYVRRAQIKLGWVELQIGKGKGARIAWMPAGKTLKDFDFKLPVKRIDANDRTWIEAFVSYVSTNGETNARPWFREHFPNLTEKEFDEFKADLIAETCVDEPRISRKGRGEIFTRIKELDSGKGR